ncbi:dGTP triphosphohydrolase [Burkholderia ubonensis]|uniref:dGTP triphosphohydrolase n=1 Tax=Burkholderia ubonensis TaxID=101571 RepID=UPI0007589CC4|nr:dNTP triphosphohydrolase [Burkholderia ubonensis]KWC65071.1 deoxyguanosinetriphosphate triphosphohydrolase [Burkholderia ubonensis]
MTNNNKQPNHKQGTLYTTLDIGRVAPVANGHEFDPSDLIRAQFRRDYARLVHCASFRRLQGKTQLFPGNESDFFRNRLTHSTEVAQIAKGIALVLNAKAPLLKDNPINTDLVELAALAHDIGHPPFGHNGEHALDECMSNYGGFEGNAQTLRIISRLEKREVNGGDNEPQSGLNLTYRSIAALLKYNRKIPLKRADRKEPKKLAKGYYESESKLIANTKKAVAPGAPDTRFKTVECQIMDIADDIAYSTYDLEDALKAEFFHPLEIISLTTNNKILDRVTKKVNEATDLKLSAYDIQNVVLQSFGKIFEDVGIAKSKDKWMNRVADTIFVYRHSKTIASDGFLRTQFTSELVKEFISGVSINFDTKFPSLSKISVDEYVRIKIETIKHLTFEALTMSPRMRVVEYRGRDIVKKIFSALSEAKTGHLLLPDDWRDKYDSAARPDKKRVICDFIAGMTDRYAMEFFARLTSTNHEHSFFKPF